MKKATKPTTPLFIVEYHDPLRSDHKMDRTKMGPFNCLKTAKKARQIFLDEFTKLWTGAYGTRLPKLDIKIRVSN